VRFLRFSDFNRRLQPDWEISRVSFLDPRAAVDLTYDGLPRLDGHEEKEPRRCNTSARIAPSLVGAVERFT
jgi:hypothetical protein